MYCDLVGLEHTRNACNTLGTLGTLGAWTEVEADFG
jgi:hypothetical protein